MPSDDSGPVLVFDIGGSHVAAAVCFRDGYRLHQPVARPYSELKSSAEFIDLLTSLGTSATSKVDRVFGASLAFPGPFNFQEGISLMLHKLAFLYGIELRSPLADRFHCIPKDVRFLNDAQAYLLGELGAGAAVDIERAVVLTLGTGVGSAFAVNGRIVTEGPGVSPGGEIWDLPYKGKTVEDAISTRAIQSNYIKRGGRSREVVDIAADASVDPAASAALIEFGRNIGFVLRDVVGQFRPDAIVIGGGIARSSHLFLPAACEVLNGHPMQLRVSKLGSLAPLVGAGVAWFNGG